MVTLAIPTESAVRVEGPPRAFGEDDTFAFTCLPDIGLRVGDLFAGAPDTTV